MHKTVIIVVIAIAAVLFFLLGYLPALSGPSPRIDTVIDGGAGQRYGLMCAIFPVLRNRIRVYPEQPSRLCRRYLHGGLPGPKLGSGHEFLVNHRVGLMENVENSRASIPFSVKMATKGR